LQKDKLSGFAVGNDNTILRTQDGGFTWQRQSLPLDLTISSVYVQDKKNAVVVGARGGYFLQTTAGATGGRRNPIRRITSTQSRSPVTPVGQRELKAGS
jgi:photosystem II stability/assembly factor-like uncharacterized protein